MDDQKNDLNAFDQMAAALNDHSITDGEGQISDEETSVENTAAQEANTVEETAQAEKPAVEESTDSQVDDTSDENQLAADETGKRYVPESRLKKETAKFREAERRAAELEKQLQSQPDRQTSSAQTKQPPLGATDRTEALEVELLKTTLPQFDPSSDQYDEILDETGSEIYRANPGITRIEAAKRALKRAEQLSKSSAAIKAEARQVKTIQSDQGITSRVEKRDSNEPDLSKETDPNKLEAYLRSKGQW